MDGLRTLLAWLTVTAVVLLVMVFVLQRRLIYLPSGQLLTPVAAGVPDAVPVTVRTADDLDLDAWYVPTRRRPAGGVVVFNGNAGNRTHRGPLAAALRDVGLATLLIDYRGYGGNPGRPTQDGLLTDARAAVTALARHSGLDDDRIVYFGESLGAAVAVGLAAERPPAALLLRSPFPSLTAVGQRTYPWLPVSVMLRDRYPASEWIAAYDGPILVVIGAEDRLVPPPLSRELVEAASGPVEVETVAGAGHNDRALLDGDEMLDAITRFVAERTAIDVRGR